MSVPDFQQRYWRDRLAFDRADAGSQPLTGTPSPDVRLSAGRNQTGCRKSTAPVGPTRMRRDARLGAPGSRRRISHRAAFQHARAGSRLHRPVSLAARSSITGRSPAICAAPNLRLKSTSIRWPAWACRHRTPLLLDDRARKHPRRRGLGNPRHPFYNSGSAARRTRSPLRHPRAAGCTVKRGR